MKYADLDRLFGEPWESPVRNSINKILHDFPKMWECINVPQYIFGVQTAKYFNETWREYAQQGADERVPVDLVTELQMFFVRWGINLCLPPLFQKLPSQHYYLLIKRTDSLRFIMPSVVPFWEINNRLFPDCAEKRGEPCEHHRHEDLWPPWPPCTVALKKKLDGLKTHGDMVSFFLQYRPDFRVCL